jgi:selenocysteine-specific elongation factor
MNTCCVVVIGHVDHGKTSLVRALTGTETDTAPEEKARGLTILPGFAHSTYPEGIIDFVDAPGHEDFIQAMVCGASGAQAALLVVSADDGISMQTLEHLQIAGLLGISQGIVAITKSDLLPQSQQASFLEGLRTTLADSALADAPVVFCSASSGDGIDRVHETLQSLLTGPPHSPIARHTCLPIDRAFSVTGRGTIVTGTLMGRSLALEDGLTLQPSGRNVTLRGLQSRGKDRQVANVGERVALNLRGVDVANVSRGMVLSTPAASAATRCIDVALNTSGPPLKHMQELRVMFGTASTIATLRLFGGGKVAAGDTRVAQLRFRTPVFGYEGQRAVLRGLSPAQTLGGAIFLDCEAQHARAGDKARISLLQAVATQLPAAIAHALCSAQGGVARLADISRLSRLAKQIDVTEIGPEFEALNHSHIINTNAMTASYEDVLSALQSYHAQHPLHLMAPRNAVGLGITSLLQSHVEAMLVRNGMVRRGDRTIALAQHDPFTQLTEMQSAQIKSLGEALQAAGLTPLPAPSTNPDLVTLLIDTGRAVRVENIGLKQSLLFHANTLHAAAIALNTAFPPEMSFTTSQARTALDTTRKVIVPLLEHFDDIGVTQRSGNIRQMTERLPVPPIALPC